MTILMIRVVCIVLGMLQWATAFAGPATAAAQEVAEHVIGKFGRGAAGQTLEEVATATARLTTRYGDEALPLLRSSGHVGYTALEAAGEQAPDVIRLYARKGDESLWIISEPKKLAIFLRHGDSAADALLKHPHIADDLVSRFGDEAAEALNALSRRQAQRLGIVAEEGLLTAHRNSPQLLAVVQRGGDEAMNFIWRNKGALAVSAALVKFLQEPEAFISGAQRLVVDPILRPIASRTSWTLIIGGVLALLLLPLASRQIAKASKQFGHRRTTRR